MDIHMISTNREFVYRSLAENFRNNLFSINQIRNYRLSVVFFVILIYIHQAGDGEMDVIN